MKPGRFDRLDALLFSLLVAAGGAGLAVVARAAYCFFDMSAFMDAGYRVACGQRPYVDFMFNAGPVQLYLHALSFRLFGFGQVAVLAHLEVAAAASMAGFYVVARRRGRLDAVVFCALAGLTTYGVVAHPWYDVTAGLWLQAAFLLWEAARPLSGRPPAWLAVVTGVLAGLSIGSKLNVGAAGAVGFLLPLLVSPGRGRSAVLYLAAMGATLAALVLTLPSPAAFAEQMLAYFPSDRLAQIQGAVVIALCTPHAYLLGLGFFLAPGARADALPDRGVHLALFLGLSATAVATVWTSSLSPFVNTALLAPELMLLVALVRAAATPPASEAGRRIQAALMPALSLAVALPFAGVAFWHVHRGSAWSGLAAESTYAMRTPRMAGWWTKPELGRGVDEAVEAIGLLVPPGESLFVFPDATVIYGLAGRESFRGAPFIFHLQNFPPPGALATRFSERLRAAPPAFILVHEQSERRLSFCRPSSLLIWLGLHELVETGYEPVWASGQFRLLKRRGNVTRQSPLPDSTL